jgi:NAD(P)-dependent dehydrogenase (short-subunit alcohol dehydrogenase family)
MAERTFTSDDQLAFAKLSGDLNPLHMDPVMARRLLFGQPIVHGLHALLWGADEHLRTRAHGLELRAVKAGFQAGIGLGRTVRCIVTDIDEHQVEMRLEIEKTPVMWARMAWSPSGRPHTDRLPTAFHEPGKCRERSFEETAGASGGIPLYLDGELAAALFPNLTRLLPPTQLAALLATTRLVGMECPGMHSVYSGLDLTFSPDRTGAPELHYQAADGNQRLALLSMDVEAPGMKGRLQTFFRPAPQRQAAFADIRREVLPDEFSGQRALIVGGSRGLGEVAAKLLAAGGAEVLITYCRGEQDAKRIVEEIAARGAKADCRPLNVLEPLPAALLSWVADRPKPLYLYYFATPFIFGAAKGRFSTRRFNAFIEYYVSGFLRTVQSVAAAPAGLKKIFYPSSAAIDELPLDMGEYAAAKTAGETLCAFLQKTNPGIAIHTPRLPRVATDQTVGLLPVGNRDPVPVLAAHLRHLRQLTPQT